MPPRPASRSRSAPRAAAPPSADGYKTLRAASETREFAPVYYLHGDDDYLKDQSLSALLDAAVDASTRDFNCETRAAADLDAQTLGSLLATPPMLAERRAVVVRDVHLLKKPVRAELEKYLARPASDTMLVLVAPAGESADPVLARLSTACVFAPLTPERVRKWIAHHATSVLGVTVTTEAAALLQQSAGDELQMLASELDKCASYARGAIRARSGADVPASITPDDAIALDGPIAIIDDAVVSAVVGVRRGETVTDLLDAIAMRDVARSASLVRLVLSQPKTGAVPIVMMLGTQLLALSWGRAKRDGGWSTSQLSGQYMNGFLKLSSGMAGRPWGEAVKAWTSAVDRWSADELRRAIRLVYEADMALKDTRVSNEEQILMTLVLAMAPQPHGRAA